MGPPSRRTQRNLSRFKEFIETFYQNWGNDYKFEYAHQSNHRQRIKTHIFQINHHIDMEKFSVSTWLTELSPLSAVRLWDPEGETPLESPSSPAKRPSPTWLSDISINHNTESHKPTCLFRRFHNYPDLKTINRLNRYILDATNCRSSTRVRKHLWIYMLI